MDHSTHIARLEQVSEYMLSAFVERLGVEPLARPNLPPLSMPLPLSIACEIAVKVLSEAYMNQSEPGNHRSPLLLHPMPLAVTIPWDIDRYSMRLPKVQTPPKIPTTLQGLKHKYPPITPTILLSRPSVILDMHGRIIAWYLPGLLSQEWQVWCLILSWQSLEWPLNIFTVQNLLSRSASHLKPAFTSYGGKPSNAGDANWRQSQSLFKAPSECPHIPPGAINISPAWYQQGHDMVIILHMSVGTDI